MSNWDKLLETDSHELQERPVIDALRKIREAGNHPSTCKELQAFVLQTEARATQENTDIANLEGAIQLARIYANAGYLEDALEAFASTRESAGAGGHMELVERIDALMDIIEGRLNDE